jgi:hypothetical protein
MKHRDVGGALARVLSLVVLGGCGGGVDTSGFSPLTCGENEQLALLPGINPAQPADYIELWEQEDIGNEPRLRGSMGTKCGTATDPAACQAAIEAATSMSGFMLGQCVQVCTNGFFVVNRGDEVVVVDTDAALAELLGAVDSPEEAALAALHAGYHVGCGDLESGSAKKTDTGWEVIATKITQGCNPVESTQYRLAVDAQGKVTEIESEVVSSESGVCIGRRPPGLAARRGRGATPLGAYFAEVAQLEAASVPAFAMLRDELRAHGAPEELVARAEEARRDEIRHARVMRALARRFGGRVSRPRVQRRPVRSLEAIALDNAVEGCVRETLGALVGGYQARTSRDAEVRRAMGPIARDETRHAELSWAIDAWVCSRLPRAARARILDARRDALREVMADADRAPEPALARVAGLPGADARRRLSEAFAELVGAWDREG